MLSIFNILAKDESIFLLNLIFDNNLFFYLQTIINYICHGSPINVIQKLLKTILMMNSWFIKAFLINFLQWKTIKIIIINGVYLNYVYRVSRKVIYKLNMLVRDIMINKIFTGTCVRKCKLRVLEDDEWHRLMREWEV